MLLGGDEFLRTQGGNNNAWCQDNATSWVDWTLAERNAEFLRFVKQDDRAAEAAPRPAAADVPPRRRGHPPDIVWHGVEPPGEPDFGCDFSRALAFALDGRRCDRPGVVDRDLYIAMNAYWEPLTFHDPRLPHGPPLATDGRHRAALAATTPLGLDEGPVIPLLHTLPRRGPVDDRPRLRGKLT